MDILAFRISSGEEIIAKATKQDNFYTIEKPRVLMLVPVERGMAITFIPWFNSNPDTTASLYDADILAVTKPTSQIEKSYLEQTTSLALS